MAATWRRRAAWFGVLAAPLLAVVVLPHAFVALAARDARAAWDRVGESLEGSWAGQPQEPDATALVLDEGARPLGLTLLVDAEASPAPSRPEVTRRRERIKRWLQDELGAATDWEGDVVPVPAEEVAASIADARAVLDAVIRVMATSPPPCWPQPRAVPVMSGIEEHERVDLADLMDLHRLLVARVLLATREGSTSVVMDEVLVTWDLAESVHARPTLVSTLVAAVMRLLVLRVVLDLGADADIDPERLGSRSTVVALLDAYEWDVASRTRDALELSRGELVDLHVPLESRRARRVLPSNWIRYQMIDEARQWPARRDEKSGLTCDAGTIEAAHGAHESARPRWQILTGDLPPRAVARAMRADLMLELVRHVLDARELRKLSGGWPAEGGPYPSSACAGLRWEYQKLGDGRMRIRLTGGTPWSPDAGEDPFPLVTEHVE